MGPGGTPASPLGPWAGPKTPGGDVEESRLFEVRGAVVAMTLTLHRYDDGIDLTLNAKRESDPLHWEREDYRSLSWSEVLDVLTAVYLG